MDAKFRADPVNRATFMEILQQPQGQTHVFRLMNDTSVLGRYLWVFRKIVGQMQHDLFHVYTVDQHIMMVLRNVRRFFIAEHPRVPVLLAAGRALGQALAAVCGALFHDVVGPAAATTPTSARSRCGATADHRIAGTTPG